MKTFIIDFIIQKEGEKFSGSRVDFAEGYDSAITKAREHLKNIHSVKSIWFTGIKIGTTKEEKTIEHKPVENSDLFIPFE